MIRNGFRTGLIVFIAIVTFLIVLYRLQPVRPGVDNSMSTPTVPSVASTPAVTPVVTVEETSCRRPYADTSIWNVPIDWSIAKLHPMNDLLMSAFFKSHNWIGSDT